MTWVIYYGDGSRVLGHTRQDWENAPNNDVQVVTDLQLPDRLRWTCDGVPVRDRCLWTGEDEYDPFGWGAKHGALIPDEQYQRIWRRACGDHFA